MIKTTAREAQTRGHVGGVEIRQLFEHLFRRQARSEQVQHVGHTDAQAPHTRPLHVAGAVRPGTGSPDAGRSAAERINPLQELDLGVDGRRTGGRPQPSSQRLASSIATARGPSAALMVFVASPLGVAAAYRVAPMAAVVASIIAH